MSKYDLILFLGVLIWAWVLMMIVTFGHLLCRQTFGGVWSSIVIDDCSGSYWAPTYSPDFRGVEGGVVDPRHERARVTTNAP